MINEILNYKGIPFAERSEAQILEALKDKGDYVQEQFLRAHEYVVKNSIGGYAKLGERTSIPSGVLSQCFNGSYPGDYSSIASRLEKFFWRMEQKELYGGIRKFCETKLSQYLWMIFEKTRHIRRIQIVQSPEQVGKTRAAEEYERRNNSRRTLYTKIRGGIRNGFGDYVWELADCMNIPYSVKLQEKRLRIRHSLVACELVLIDEAHLIWSWTDRSIMEFLDFMRTDIHSDGERGVVLIATNSDMMSGINRFQKRFGYNVGQFLGRMRNQTENIEPARDIIYDDVKMLVERYYKPSNGVVATLHDVAIRDHLGHFGIIDDVMTEAWTRSKSAGKALSDETVLSTLKEVMEELKGRKDLYK